MNTVKQIVRRVVFPACMIYTLISLVFSAIASTGNPNFAPTFSSLGLFLAFSVLIALCNMILRIQKWNLLLRLFLHYGSVMISIYLLLFFASGQTGNTGAMMILGVLFTVIYLLFAVIYATVRRATAKEKPEKYKKQFNGL